ncbi:transposase family protein [Pseudonocardia adelaidensis]
MTVPNRALITVTDVLRRTRNQRRTRWRRLPGARHDMGAAREHGITDALVAAGVQVVADSGYRGVGPTFDLPQRRRPADPATGARQRLSRNQREVNAAHAAQHGPGERPDAVFKSWRVLRKIRCCPLRTTALVNAIQVLIVTG